MYFGYAGPQSSAEMRTPHFFSPLTIFFAGKSMQIPIHQCVVADASKANPYFQQIIMLESIYMSNPLRILKQTSPFRAMGPESSISKGKQLHSRVGINFNASKPPSLPYTLMKFTSVTLETGSSLKTVTFCHSRTFLFVISRRILDKKDVRGGNTSYLYPKGCNLGVQEEYYSFHH